MPTKNKKTVLRSNSGPILFIEKNIGVYFTYKNDTIYSMKSLKIEQFIKTWPEIPELAFIKALAKKYPKAEFFLVGGMVRDLLLNKDSQDFDFVVRHIPIKKLEGELARLGKVSLVGKNFGVLKFVPKNSRLNHEIDIALPRTEIAYKTGRYKDVTVKSHHETSIENDLARRDFTINAMALKLNFQIPNPKSETNSKFKTPLSSSPLPVGERAGEGEHLKLLKDPFGGIKDLKAKKIRAVGKPLERFQEDYSRILRALRFSIQLDFTIEASTIKATKQKISHLNQKDAGEYLVPREVIAKELVKMFSFNPVASLKILDATGALKILIPELLKMKKCPQPKQFHAEGDVWEHTLLALEKLNSKEFHKEFFSSHSFLSPRGRGIKGEGEIEIPQELVFALLFHDLGKPYTMTKTDRIRFNGHDMKSAKLFSEIANRLKLSSAGLDIEKTRELIAKHMILSHGNIKDMKETTVEKYFFNENFPGAELLMESFADVSATIPKSGKSDFTKYKMLKKRIATLQKKMKSKKILPKPLLDGNDIMKILKLKPGPEIGRIKSVIREEQLKGSLQTPQDVKNFIIKKFKK